MSTLIEIEKAVEALPAREKRELLLFVAANLRSAGARPPELRDFSRTQVEGWIADDEAALKRFKAGA
jgi:hypothetical protein